MGIEMLGLILAGGQGTRLGKLQRMSQNRQYRLADDTELSISPYLTV